MRFWLQNLHQARLHKICLIHIAKRSNIYRYEDNSMFPSSGKDKQTCWISQLTFSTVSKNKDGWFSCLFRRNVTEEGAKSNKNNHNPFLWHAKNDERKISKISSTQYRWKETETLQTILQRSDANILLQRPTLGKKENFQVQKHLADILKDSCKETSDLLNRNSGNGKWTHQKSLPRLFQDSCFSWNFFYSIQASCNFLQYWYII